MSDIQIRPAAAADLAAITAIYREEVLHGTATFELIPPDLVEMTRRFEALTSAGFPWLSALLDGRVVGYAYAGSFHARPAYRFTVEDSIYLASDSQRRGIGTRLVQRLIEECEVRGFRQIVAVIGDSANAGSIGVHVSAGFQMIGIHPDVGFKFGRWLDVVMMQHAIGGGGRSVPDDDPAQK
ncbi:GNAT family N-acetyltransferase [Tardiphaga sp.]|uniref:GNAT family N-acetyltransferase n=1 Tax=Tardiphaga sp. TaxID=1926292 RepID=UPI00261F0493|nr:GNAT family N-acetyltransferase [Tardiphaga sp.]MDB5617683.1 phosphinothricin acetyltransferase [Tardiphaga sp.]